MKKQKVLISLDEKEDVLFVEIESKNEEQIGTKESMEQGFSQLILSTEILLGIIDQLFSKGFYVSACSYFEGNFLSHESEESRKEVADQLISAMRLFPALKKFWIDWLKDQTEKSSLIIQNISFSKMPSDETQEPEITISANGTIVVKDELKEALKKCIKDNLC